MQNGRESVSDWSSPLYREKKKEENEKDKESNRVSYGDFKPETKYKKIGIGCIFVVIESDSSKQRIYNCDWIWHG